MPPRPNDIDPRIFGDRLAAARKAAGKTQEEAADYLEMSRPTYIAMEKGVRPAQASEVSKLAGFFGRTVHELVRPGAPITLEPHLRAEVDPARPGADDLFSAIREFERFADDYRQLEELLDAPLVANPPPEVQLPSRGNLQLQDLAEDVASRERDRLQLGDQPILNMRRMLELEVGVRVFFGRLPSRIAGMYAFAANFGYCVLINRNHPPERQRMSLAHEYAHFLIDRYRPGIDYLEPNTRKPVNERFAEAFALAFLMPLVGLRRHFNDVVNTTKDFRVADLVQLSHFYFVSVQAMALRLERLGLIGKGWWESLDEAGFRPQALKRELNLAQRTEPQESYPERYKFLAVQAFQQELISEGQLSKFLRCDRVMAREIVDDCLNRLETRADGDDTILRLPFEKSLLGAP
jgi:Zn-dependent peptidase ImmA (M78 family)/DNA-binding XRE family transcriptional regulator